MNEDKSRTVDLAKGDSFGFLGFDGPRGEILNHNDGDSWGSSFGLPEAGRKA